jgi:hypothetical protein
MQSPKEYYTPKFINVFEEIASNLCNHSVSLDKIDVMRNIVDLKMKHNSYNDIADHCSQVLGINIPLTRITSIIVEAGQRAKFLNGIYDAMVRPQILILEIDEIFQGRNRSYLGATDKFSRYLLKLESLDNRSIESIEAVLRDFAENLDHLELVITDGLPAYKTVIPDIFDLIAHLFCHVHAYRIFLRDQQPINRAAKKAYSKIKESKAEALNNQRKTYNKHRVLKRMESRLKKLISKRDAYYRQQGIKKSSQKMQWAPEQLYYKVTLNSARSNIRSVKITIKNMVENQKTLKTSIASAETTYKEKKQESLQNARLIQRFKSLFSCALDNFTSELESFKEVLKNSKRKLAPDLLKFIKNNSHVFANKTEELSKILTDNKANTNGIEGIFGIVRPLLNQARLFHDTPQSEAILEIFRFKYNFSKPRTGPNRDQSPLERCGVHSQYKTYLDALFPNQSLQDLDDRRNVSKWSENDVYAESQKVLLN